MRLGNCFQDLLEYIAGHGAGIFEAYLELSKGVYIPQYAYSIRDMKFPNIGHVYATNYPSCGP